MKDELEEEIVEQVYAYLWIADFDCDFSEITRLMGLEPTEAWNKGDVVVWKREGVVKERAWKFSSWALYSPLPRNNLLLDHHITALLGIIEPRKEVLTYMRSQGWTIGVNCVGEFTANPGAHLSAELISRCASLSLSVDFDFYCLTD
jgi:hypothetical protein